MDAAAKIVMDAVRANDYDRYLSTLYAPEGRRGALAALFAFNAEIAGIRDRIREALPGEIRIQWWQDTLSGKAGPSGVPVADALMEAIDTHDLPLAAFENYLEARIFDLYDDPMPSRTDLEGYCGETAGATIQLAALILDAEAAPKFAELAGRAGCAQAMTGLLRLVPIHRARGQCYIPRDILEAAGSSPEAFVSGQDQTGARNAIAAMAALANEHLQAFEQAAHTLPQSLRPAYLPLALTGPYLRRIMDARANSLNKTADIANWRRQWLILRRASKGWPKTG